jgi:aminopeptidase N
MYPSWIIKESTVDRTNAWLSGEGKDAPAVLRKLLKESQDGVIRALKVQKLDS